MASAAIVFSWIPQIRRILVTRSAEDISYGLPALLMIGSALWVAYGIHLNDVIIATVNSIVILLNFLVLILKRKYGA